MRGRLVRLVETKKSGKVRTKDIEGNFGECPKKRRAVRNIW